MQFVEWIFNSLISFDQSEKERLSLVTDKEELEVELGALKRELVKAEELRMRLESFNATLERSLQTANSDNDDMKEQIEHLIQVKVVHIISFRTFN